MFKFIIYSFLFSFFFSGNLVSCKSNKNLTNNKKNMVSKNNSIPFSVILQGEHSNVDKQKNIIITNNEELSSFYSKINMTRTPDFPVPKVNFKKNIVLGLFMGTKTTGGYSIEIDKIESYKNEIIVFYKEKSPKGMATMVITQPCLIVSIPKKDLPIRFKKVE